jgi:hypothetical protein
MNYNNDDAYYDDLRTKITIGNCKHTKSRTTKKIKMKLIEECENMLDAKKVDSAEIIPYAKTEGNLFNYEGNTIHVIEENGVKWFRGKDIALTLGYKNTNDALLHNVKKSERKEYGKFSIDVTNNQNAGLKIQKTTIYITKEGVFNLILESKLKSAKKFRLWVAKLLNEIDDGKDIYEENKSGFIVTVVDEYTDWTLSNNSSELRNENIIYLAIIGKITNIVDASSTNVSNE